MRVSQEVELGHSLRLFYDGWMEGGRNTIEKHIRWMAESLVKDLDGGFGVSVSVGRSRIRTIRVDGIDVVLHLYIPYGLLGFALQLSIEDEIRRQIREAKKAVRPANQQDERGDTDHV